VEVDKYTSVRTYNFKIGHGLMTEAQQEDLFTEWELYSDVARRDMLHEYQDHRRGRSCVGSFLDFLKVKLEIEGYWKKVGLA
jgi:hypothetical protein